jgi:hypothetical protein
VGRGFVVNHRGYLSHIEPIVITAAHCLPRKLRPPHPARYLEEATYRRLLGPLGGKRTVWAQCLFVDPVADIAVLGQPDTQALSEEADAYDELIGTLAPLPVADAPKQGVKLQTLPGVGGRSHQIKRSTPGEGAAFVLSLDGQWHEGKVERRGNLLSFKPRNLFVGGMSGSPILNTDGAAIGVVSVDIMNPVIIDNLSAHLVQSIRRIK